MTTITRRSASPCVARHRIRERDAARRDFQIELNEGEAFEDTLRPEFFGAKADIFQPGDRIAVVGFELEFWAELVVCECDEALAVVRTVPLHMPIDLKARLAEALPYDLSRVQIEQLEANVWRLKHGTKIIASGFKSQKAATDRLNEIRAGRKASRPGE